jgi:hypothetical protein
MINVGWRVEINVKSSSVFYQHKFLKQKEPACGLTTNSFCQKLTMPKV